MLAIHVHSWANKVFYSVQGTVSIEHPPPNPVCLYQLMFHDVSGERMYGTPVECTVLF